MSDFIIEKVSKFSVKGLMKLLPKLYKPYIEVRILRRIWCVECPKGWIALYSSKDFTNMPKWRVKPFENNSEIDIAYWAFGLDLRGMLLIPSDIVNEFCNTYAVSRTPSGKWKLGIHEFDGRYYLYAHDSLKDVSDFFIPSTAFMKSLESELYNR